MIKVIPSYEKIIREGKRVDISPPGLWGNPFWMKTEAQRDQVCDKHEKYFLNRLKYDESFRDAFLDLHHLTRHNHIYLSCKGNCAPQRCHGDFIKRCLESDLYEKFLPF